MKDTCPLISVIVPIYNTEKYLRRCIDSILAQTFSDFELILVNDGSRDSSGAICDEYEDRDERVVVIHQENSGVSVARNHGMEVAKGKYISFVDSDDWVEVDYLDSFAKELENNPNGELYSQDVIQINADKESILYSVFQSLSFCVAKLFDAHIIQQHHLMFPSKVANAEDTLFMIDYLDCIEDVKYINNVGYHYETNDSGACERVKSRPDVYMEGLMRELRIIDRGLFRNELTKQYAYYRTSIQYHFFILSLYHYHHSANERRKYLKELFSLGKIAESLYPIMYKSDKVIKKLFVKKWFIFGDLLNYIIWRIRK